MQINVSELMDTPAGCDEVGTPDSEIERCDDCGALFRSGGWHACTDDDARGDGGAAIADGGHELPAGWVRVYDGTHKLTKHGADIEIQITDHCVGIAGDDVDQQGWQVDDPTAVGVRLAAALEDNLSARPAGASEKRLMADGSGGEMPFNGPGRELRGEQDHLEESVYCTQCGTIFVRNGTGRDCPSCAVAERLDEIEKRLDNLEGDDKAIAEHIVESHGTIDERLEEIEERLDRAERDIEIVDGGF